MLSNGEKNRIFHESSHAAQRVMIARDVIERLSSRGVAAEEGTYFSFYPSPDGPICEVCAIGAMFMAGCGFQTKDAQAEYKKIDHESPNNSAVADALYGWLQPWFSEEQLGMIESAFERRERFAEKRGSTTAEAKRAADFGRDYHHNVKNRLRAIMGNIIENEGEFKP